MNALLLLTSLVFLSNQCEMSLPAVSIIGFNSTSPVKVEKWQINEDAALPQEQTSHCYVSYFNFHDMNQD